MNNETHTLRQLTDFADAARAVCAAGSMHWLSVRPSVCLSRRSTAATAVGEFAAERFAGRIDSCWRAAGAVLQQGAGAQQQIRQRHVESRWRFSCIVRIN